MNDNLPPELDEIEISIFGPGYGESIAIHLGQKDWIIVDSCSNTKGDYPAPLDYLNKIGVDISSAVKLIVATHWHDDHIRGLSKIIEECLSAEVVFSDALNSEEIFTIICAYKNVPLNRDTSGLNELYYSLDILNSRRIKNPLHFVSPNFASANKCLWRKEYIYPGKRLSCNVIALLPSKDSILSSKLEISKWIPEIPKTKRRIAHIDPNHIAIVLLVSIGNKHILLGSDLEETNSRNTGWSAILINQNLPQNKCSVFKIPHHGSITAYNQDIWTEMLDPNPFAVLTPFIKAGQELPTTNDVERITSLTSNAFSTAKRLTKRPPRRQNIVEKQIKETTLSFRQIYPQVGQVTLRSKYESNSYQVSLSGGALHLKEYYQ